MKRRWLTCLLAFTLVAVTLAVFWPVRQYGFYPGDDAIYVHQNPWVTRGLTREGTVWALGSTGACNWQPLTWFSHMLDVELFGLRPGSHHLMSLGYHAAAALILFLVLGAMTASAWFAFVVAALFALHPFHVESVVWISDRKDVIAGLFWMAGMGSYLLYTRKPSWGRYLPLLLFLALGGMAKASVITFPFALLLLDYWPLGRLGPAGPRGPGRTWARAGAILLEKAPLLAVSSAIAIITYRAQGAGGAVVTGDYLPFLERGANAISSSVAYVLKTIWPLQLAFFYPYRRGDIAAGMILLQAALLLVVTALVFRERARRPYLLVGWLWFAGTLVPVIGLVQVGAQAMADRYTYVPLIGLFIMAAGLARAGAQPAAWRVIVPAVTAGLLLTFALLTRIQVGYWRDEQTLFRQALRVTGDNWCASLSLGYSLSGEGNYSEAEYHFREALRQVPNHPAAHHGLAGVLRARGMLDEAERHYREALSLDPSYRDAFVGLGDLLADRGRCEQALLSYEQALRLYVDDAALFLKMAQILRDRGYEEQAQDYARAALRIDPASVAALELLKNMADDE